MPRQRSSLFLQLEAEVDPVVFVEDTGECRHSGTGTDACDLGYPLEECHQFVGLEQDSAGGRGHAHLAGHRQELHLRAVFHRQAFAVLGDAVSTLEGLALECRSECAVACKSVAECPFAYADFLEVTVQFVAYGGHCGIAGNLGEFVVALE